MAAKYKIGNSIIIGNLVCKPYQLTEVGHDFFYHAINKSITKNNLNHYINIVNRKSNLKKGVTIGDDYFIIEN